MEGPEFIYFIKKDTTHFYSMDNNNSLVLSTEAIPLEFSPDGWQDISIQNQRNKRYWGLDRMITIPYKFVEDGAQILKNLVYRYGIETKAYLQIFEQRLDIDRVSSAVFNITNGDIPFQAFALNTGTLTGTPGETVYLRIDIHSVLPSSVLLGTFGPVLLSVHDADSPFFFSVVIPSSGFLDYSLRWITPIPSTATIIKVNSIGSEADTYCFWYKMLMNSEIDLGTFDHIGFQVTATMSEGSLPKYLSSNAATIYDIPLNVSAAIPVLSDGLKLHEKLNFVMADGVSYVNVRYVPAFIFISNEGSATGITYLSQNFEAVSGAAGADEAYVIASDNFFFRNNSSSNIIIRIIGKLKYRSDQNDTSPPSSTLIKVKSNIDNGFGGTLEYPLLDDAPAEGVDLEVDVDQIITVIPSEKLFMFGVTTSVNELLYDFHFLPGSDLRVEFVTRFPSSVIRCLRPSYIFAYLIDKISEGNLSVDVAVGSLLDRESNKVFTSGDGIRNIDTAVIKTSLSDFFDFWDTWMDGAITVLNGKVVMKQKIEMCDYNQVTDLGEVSNFGFSIATDYLFNVLKIGYPDAESQDTVNGKFTWLNTFQWTLGTMRVAKELNKVCKYVVDCYSVEWIRITYLQKQTTNAITDNTVYVLHIEDSITVDSYKLNRDLNPFLTGLVEIETVFNAGLSPKRCLNNNGAFLHSCLDLVDNKIIKFTTSPKNQDVATTSPLVIEKADVLVGSLPARFFKPYWLRFDTPGPNDLLDELDLNPLRLYKGTINGIPFKGIPEKVGLEPSTRKIQTYRLLCSSDTDITLLIEYYGK